MLIKKRKKSIQIWCIIAIGYIFGGCMLSPSYHMQMLIGKAEPRPFPIVRYWAEYSEEDFHDNVLAVPLAVPFLIPIGYVGDFCWDTIFLPLDLPLSLLVSEPEIKMKACVNNRYAITVYTATAQLHEDESLLKGAIPISIQVKSGSLTIRISTRTRDEGSFLITSQEITYTEQDYYGKERIEYAKTSQSERIRFMCEPPQCSLEPLLLSLLEPYNAAPRVFFSPSIENENRHLYRMTCGVSMYKEKECIMTIDFSPDFLGECSYNGMPVSEVRFVYD